LLKLVNLLAAIITQPLPQDFSFNGSTIFDVNGSLIFSRLPFWGHFDVSGSIICSRLHLTSSVEYDKILCKFGQQQLVMMSYVCGFNKSETRKYLERIIIIIHQGLL